MILKRHSVFVLLSLIRYIGFSQCADTSNIFTFQFEGKKYEIVKELKSWENAAACAVERGGYLVRIDSEEEDNAMYEAITNGAAISSSYTTVNDGGGIAYIWIGATDKATEGEWLWDGDNDGQGLMFWNGQGNAGAGGGSAIAGRYNNWGGTSNGMANEPDDYNSNQDAGAIALNGWPGGSGALGVSSEWNDIATTNQLYYIIEYDSVANNIGSDFNESILIYPNPVKDYLFVNAAYKESSLSIYNVLGVKLYEKKISDCTDRIDMSSFREGNYLLELVDGQNRIIRHIVKY